MYRILFTGNRTLLTTVIQDHGHLDSIQRVLFGSGLRFWLHRLLFLDSLSYLSHGQLSLSLERMLLMDVDDMFVGERGKSSLMSSISSVLLAGLHGEGVQNLNPVIAVQWKFISNQWQVIYYQLLALLSLGVMSAVNPCLSYATILCLFLWEFLLPNDLQRATLVPSTSSFPNYLPLVIIICFSYFIYNPLCGIHIMYHT